VSLDVLVPVERRRRRRRRYRLRRLAPLFLVLLIVAGFGVWYGRRHSTAPPHHRSAAARQPKSHPAAQTVAPPSKPPRLIYGAPLLEGKVQAHVQAPAAILVDADTGRVLWAERPHQRRKIASLTKIMTATLALHEVPWDSTITVDKRVTTVPLV
jgi:D-alanyl-D-alanine carboxypeptidase